jgi:voltage-gated potassium channel
MTTAEPIAHVRMPTRWEPRADRARRRAFWERWMEWPLYAAAVLFLGAYAWPILQPTLGSSMHLLCEVLTWATWAMFAVDYAVQLYLNDRRLEYVRKHIFDLAVVVLPLLRPLRLLRLLTTLNALNRSATISLRGHVAAYVVSATSLVVFGAALAVLDAERGAKDATITTFGDALWWAFTTVTTVGYGDRYPATPEGRLVAVGLMLCGIALLGVVTATLASWLVQRVSEAQAETHVATREHIAQLERKIDELHAATLNRPQNPTAAEN